MQLPRSLPRWSQIARQPTLWLAALAAVPAPAAQASAHAKTNAAHVEATAPGEGQADAWWDVQTTDLGAAASASPSAERGAQGEAEVPPWRYEAGPAVLETGRDARGTAPRPATEQPTENGWPNPSADEPMNFWVQRQEYGYWTHYLLQTPEGAPWGVVERRHWRQPWRRCFEGVDGDGVLRARATQPWLSPGNLFSWQAEMRFHDAAGRPLGHLSGSLWTLKAASYTLYDARGSAVAEASVDDCGQGVMVYAYGTRRLLATLLREQQATNGSDRWVVRVEPGAPLEPAAWPLLASFFADVWSRVARGCVEGL